VLAPCLVPDQTHHSPDISYKLCPTILCFYYVHSADVLYFGNVVQQVSVARGCYDDFRGRQQDFKNVYGGGSGIKRKAEE